MKNKKIIIFLIVALTVLVGGFLIKADSSQNVSGWAWSENIGWISFNCDQTPVGGTNNCTASNTYGVNVDSNGWVSGYAWAGGGVNADGSLAPTIGWITFNLINAAPPGEYNYSASGYMAKLDFATNELRGWARACGIPSGGSSVQCGGDGWDGWIKLRKYPTDLGADYGVIYNPLIDEFTGWAWGSDVVGWVSFNSLNCDSNGDGFSDGALNCPSAGTPISDYAVKLVGLNLPPYVGSGSALITSQNYCGILAGTGQINFEWTYQDSDADNQSNYRLQIATDSGFSSLVVDSTNPQIVSPGGKGSSAVRVVPSPTPVISDLDIGYNQSYWWRVKVQDANLNWAVNWEGGPNFTTPTHAYPWTDFTHSPASPSLDEVVNFTDNSTCYNSTNVAYSCNTNALNRYQWDFKNDGTVDCDSNINADCRGDVSSSYSAVGDYTVKLTITDDIGICSGQGDSPVSVEFPLPEWREVAP